MKAFIKLEFPGAKLPEKATAGSAGYDLFAAEEISIPPRSRALVSLGFTMAFPPNVYARIAPRSGLAVKNSVDVGAGVVDSDYRGVVRVLLINNGTGSFNVTPGSRIAQMIFERVEHPTLCEVSEIADTIRGAGGFGSTGV
jgi:deoxyuridine 5'-triphosphate nucleotidohydrolase